MKNLSIGIRPFEEVDPPKLKSRVRIRFHLDRQWWKLRSIWFEFNTNRTKDGKKLNNQINEIEEGEFVEIIKYELSFKYDRLNWFSYYVKRA